MIFGFFLTLLRKKRIKKSRNDKNTALSLYFNKTIEKIGTSSQVSASTVINIPRRKRRGTVLNVSHCVFYKVVAVGFNTLCYDASVGVLNPPHE